MNVLAQTIAAMRRSSKLDSELGPHLTEAADTLDQWLPAHGCTRGELMAARSWDWVSTEMPPSSARPEAGDDEIDRQRRNSRTTRAEEDGKLDAQATRYHTELNAVLHRLWCDTARLDRLYAITSHPQRFPTYQRLARSLRTDCNRVRSLAEIIDPGRVDTLQATGGEPGCWSCARTQVRPGVPRWNEIWKTVELGGIIRPARPLCRACGDFTYRNGRLPTTAEVEMKASSGRWPRERVA